MGSLTFCIFFLLSVIYPLLSNGQLIANGTQTLNGPVSSIPYHAATQDANNFVIIYAETSSSPIKIASYDGNTKTTEFNISQTGTPSYPRVASLNNTYIVGVWKTAADGVRGRICSTTGCSLNEFRVDTNLTVTTQDYPKVTTLGTSLFVIAWKETTQKNVLIRIYQSSDGTPVTQPIQVINGTAGNRLEIISVWNGAQWTWILVSDVSTGINGIIGLTDGSISKTSSLGVGNYVSAAAAVGHPNNIFGITYVFNSKSLITAISDSTDHIVFRSFYPNLTIFTSTSNVSVSTAATQGVGASMSALPNGLFAVAWDSMDQDVSGTWGSYTSIVYGNGTRQFSSDARLNDVAAGNQYNSIAAGFLSAGPFQYGGFWYDNSDGQSYFKISNMVAASPSPSPSVTPSTTPTPSITPTTSVTATPSAMPSISPSVTPSITASPSQTPSPSTSPTSSVSSTPSASSSVTPSPVPSTSPSSSSSASPSSSPSSSPSVSPTPSVTPSVTPTPFASPSSTPTRTPSISVCPSVTPSITTTPSVSATPSVTPSLSPSTSQSTTPSSSTNPSASPTSSVSCTPSVTPSVTPSTTPSITPSHTPSSSSLSPSISASSPAATPSGPATPSSGSSSPTPSPDAKDTTNQQGGPSPAVIGGVVGGIGGGMTCGIVIIVFFVHRKKKTSEEHQALQNLELQPGTPSTPSSTYFSITPSPSTPLPPENPQPAATPTKKNDDKGWKIKISDVTVKEELGRGAFGVVHKCVWRNTDCVIKLLTNTNDNAIKAFLREAENVKNLRNHPNVCAILGVCEDPVAIIMEYVPGGNLLNCIANKKVVITPAKVIKFAKDIASGMSHLHAENIMHLDLEACRNLLVAFRHQDDEQIKITDFGLSRIMEAETYTASKDATFPVRWTAPETLSMGIISRASDVWSFAVCIWEMIERKMPFLEIPAMDVIQHVLQGGRLSRPQSVKIPDSLWELMQDCWKDIPAERPTFEQICSRLKAIEQDLEDEEQKEQVNATEQIEENPEPVTRVSSIEYGNQPPTYLSLDAPK